MPRPPKPTPFKEGYDDTGKCKLCKEMRTDEGHDPCIANLPGVLYACCGHGQENGYIKFADGRFFSFIPLSIDLNCPTHYIVTNPDPIRVNGEYHPTLIFKTGKEKIEQSWGIPILPEGEKLVRDAEEKYSIKESER